MTLALIGTPAILTVRDAIAAILSTEIDYQRSIATGVYKTILDSFYNAGDELNLFVARATPLDAEERNGVVITVESETLESWSFKNQKSGGRFNIDVIVGSKSTVASDGATLAENYLLTMYGTIKQILMAQKYSRLGLAANAINRRKIAGMTQYDLQGVDNSDYVRGVMINFEVDYDELTISETGLEFLGNDTTYEVNEVGRFSLETDETDL